MLGFGRWKQEMRELNVREVLRKCGQPGRQHHWLDCHWTTMALRQDLN